MKKIESKRPRLLGKIRRRNPTESSVANFTPQIELSIIQNAEAQAVKDGFPYFRDLVLVLMALYGNGAVSQKLERDLPQTIKAWAARDHEKPGKVVKRNYKLRRDIFERAEERWKGEAPGLTTTAMFAFLLESYAEGEIEFALRRGKASEGS